MLLQSVKYTKARCYAVVALIVLAMPRTSVAQETGVDAGEQPPASQRSAPPDDIDVIRVLGPSQSQIDTSTPTSATQFDRETLQSLGAVDISDLAEVTPNLEIRVAGSTTPTFFIRGVGLSDFSSNASGAVAVYQDGVAMNAPALQLGQLFDVENVEVLRGPQGGGAGRNASAGAIKVVSRKPVGDPNASLFASYGNYNALDLEGAVEAPVLRDTLSARLAFRLSQRDGWGKNRCGGNPVSQEAGDSTGGLPMIPLDKGPDGIFGPNPLGDYEYIPGTRNPREFEQVKAPGPNDDSGRTSGENARIYDDVTFCGERPTLQVGNPDQYRLYEGGPTYVVAQGEPAGWRVSRVPTGLRSDVNDVGTWAARGLLRFQPDKADMDWLLIARGGRLDQLSELGQAVGTRSSTGAAAGYPTGTTQDNYREPDIAAVADSLVEACILNAPDPETAALCRAEVNALLAPEIAKNLDPRPKDGDYNRTGDTKLDTWGVSLSGEIGLGGGIRLTTITAFDSYDRFRDEDFDFTSETLFEAITDDDGWQASHEFIFTGELDEYPFGWEAGGYILGEQLKSFSDFFTGPPPLGFTSSGTQRFSQDMLSFGIYAGFNWEFLDDFRLEGGVRYNWEGKAFSLAIDEDRKTGGQIDDSRVWQAPTGSLSLIYHPRDDVSVYWRYSRGWKGGHFNASSISLDTPTPPAEPETIDAWEIGMNGYLAEGRLGLSAALFYYSYDQYQVFIVEDNLGAFPQLQIINANDAEVYGAEVEARVEPLAGLVPEAFDRLLLTARFGWLESEFLDFTNTQLRSVQLRGRPPRSATLPVAIDFTGNQLINAPRFKLSLGAEWSFSLGSFGSITPRYDGAWSDDIFFDATEGRGSVNVEGTTVLPEFAIGQPAFWLHNLSLKYRTPKADVELTAWVRNLTDEVYKTFAFDAVNFGNVVVNYVGEPRTYGLSLSFHF